MAATTWRPATDDPELACPTAPVVDIVFSRWTTPILWALNEYGRQRFVELSRRITTITPKVLTQRLRQLERDGLVVRTYHAEVPPRVEYEALLRPAFRQDEWKLIAVGAVIGALIGELQVFLFLH